jgi:uncharacterized protein YuzE
MTDSDAPNKHPLRRKLRGIKPAEIENSGMNCGHCLFRLAKGKQRESNMAKREILEKKTLSHLLKAVAHLVQLPKTHMRLDYDDEADVLYLHFEDRPGSTYSEMRNDGVILDYKGRRLVGVTILDASQR